MTERDYLTENSVVLITGAAGFIGSELAIALYRTYNPKKIVCVDSMDGVAPKKKEDDKNGSKKPKGDGDEKKKDDGDDAQRRLLQAEEDLLAMIEFKRQRVFHLLQTAGTTTHFYRTDFRPNVPEFSEAGEVPILRYILSQHPDVTHVVHLADRANTAGRGGGNTNQQVTQAIPALQGETKAGMMEALLEELVRIKDEKGADKVPHFVYASSHEVYNNRRTDPSGRALDEGVDPNPPPFREHLPITTPSSFVGAAKLMDEILAHSYGDSEQIYSVGVRLFDVYGPWGVPGSPTFEMAERIVLSENSDGVDGGKSQQDDINDGTVKDFVYIDDAVDAIMAAMQFRPPPEKEQPIVVNVGSGRGTSLRQVESLMEEAWKSSDGTENVHGTKEKVDNISSPKTVSVASLNRAKQLLGYEPRIPLERGIEHLLAWHYDRAFPYGNGPPITNQNISSVGIGSCSPYDQECLKGAPLFPCASECSRPQACVSTVYDDVVDYTREVTKNCESVLYTVALDEKLVALPSTQISGASSKSAETSFLQQPTCNLAFVSDASPLIRNLVETSSATPGAATHLAHGRWILVPLSTKSATESLRFLQLLPKLSPGKFFNSPKTKHAIYADPDVIFGSIPLVLEEFNKTPSLKGTEGRDEGGQVAIMIGKKDAMDEKQRLHLLLSTSSLEKSPQEIVQEIAYRMIRIAVIDELNNDGFSRPIDSSFVVHRMQNDDVRLFRCDAFGEIVQWDVPSDTAALQFIIGLHDMWNGVIDKRRRDQPWWANGNMKQERSFETKIQAQKPEETNADKNKKKTPEVQKDQDSRNKANGKADEITQKKDPTMDGRRRLEAEESEDGEDEEGVGGIISGWGHEHNGFGMPEAIQDAVRAVFGDALVSKQETPQVDDDDDVEEDADSEEDEDSSGEDGEEPEKGGRPSSEQDFGKKQRQPSSDASVWMGVLSSSDSRYYARIVPSRQLDAIRIAQLDEDWSLEER